MAKISSVCDYFFCPHRLHPWHFQALKLVQEIDKSSSPSLKRLMEKDLKEIIEYKRTMS
jgi:hypothetical protein